MRYPIVTVILGLMNDPFVRSNVVISWNVLRAAAEASRVSISGMSGWSVLYSSG